jgi:hypothetical protein
MAKFPQKFLDTFIISSDFSRILAQGGQVNLPRKELEDKVKSILQTCYNEKFPGGVLPRFLANNIVYYLVAQTAKEWRGLRPLAMAFAGPTVTSFIGQSTRLDASDSVDALLIEKDFNIVAKIGVPRTVSNFDSKKLIALAAIHRMALLGMEHAGRGLSYPETTSSLLQRFEHALVTGDEEAAESALQTLREGLHLDALNLKFLRVHLLARSGKWRILREKAFFPSLCMTRRPDKVTIAMVEALYQTELVHFENDFEALVEAFRKKVLPFSGALFEKLPKGASNNVLKAFAAYAMTTPPNMEMLRQGLNTMASHPDRGIFAAFWKVCSNKLDYAKPIKEKPAFDSIVNTPPPPDPERAFQALAVAFSEEDMKMAKMALAFVNKLKPEEKSKVLGVGKYHAIYRYLKEIALSGWMEWLIALTEKDFNQYYEIARRAMMEWRVRDEIEGSRDAVRFKETLEQVQKNSVGQKRLIDCLPLILGWIEGDDRFPEPMLVPAYLSLMEIYSLSERITEEALGSFARLLDGVLLCGLDTQQYNDAIDTALILGEGINSARALDWFIEIVEIVVDHQAPVESKRTELIWTVFEQIRRMLQPISVRQLNTLRCLMKALGIDEDSRISALNVDEKESSPLMALYDRHIAIYTLTEDAGRRAAEIIMEIASGVKVSLNHDSVGSKALKHLVRGADLFVVVTRSAKHAVTEFIRQHRPKDKPILYPQGKGSASIVRALENWVETSFSETPG